MSNNKEKKIVLKDTSGSEEILLYPKTLAEIVFFNNSSETVSSKFSNMSGNLSDHIANTSNPHMVDKAQVGLGNVADTSDGDTPTENGLTKFTTGGAYTLQTALNSNISNVASALR